MNAYLDNKTSELKDKAGQSDKVAYTSNTESALQNRRIAIKNFELAAEKSSIEISKAPFMENQIVKNYERMALDIMEEIDKITNEVI